MNVPPAPEPVELTQRITALIEDGDLAALEPLLQELHPSDIADVVESFVTQRLLGGSRTRNGSGRRQPKHMSA